MNLGASARGLTVATGLVLGACGGGASQSAAVPPATVAEVKGKPHRTAVGDRVKPVLAPFRIPAPGAKMTLVHYFATWCESSKRWMPKVEEMSKKYRAAGLVVVGVGHYGEETTAGIELFARELGATFPIVFDAKHEVTEAIPPLSWGQSIIVVDRESVVRVAHLGSFQGAFEEVDAAVGRLLAQAPP